MGRSSARLAARLAAGVAALTLTLGAGSAPLPRAQLKVGPHTLDVEVAATAAARARGLKGRSDLADNAGMLFVFDDADEHCFWMKGTAIPLSIVFIADDGTVVGIADMQPETSELHCAPEPVRYALEVKRSALRIDIGARLSGGPF